MCDLSVELAAVEVFAVVWNVMKIVVGVILYEYILYLLVIFCVHLLCILLLNFY